MLCSKKAPATPGRFAKARHFPLRVACLGLTVLFASPLAVGQTAADAGRPVPAAQAKALQQVQEEKRQAELRSRLLSQYLSEDKGRQQRLENLIDALGHPPSGPDGSFPSDGPLAARQLAEAWAQGLQTLPENVSGPSRNDLATQLRQLVASANRAAKPEQAAAQWRSRLELQAALLELKATSLVFANAMQGALRTSLQQMDGLKVQTLLLESAPSAQGVKP